MLRDLLPESADAEAILSAMAGVYAQCRTYRDSGRVISAFFPDGRAPYTREKPFCTAFIRPDQFRFEYQKRLLLDSPFERTVVRSHRDEVRVWSPLGGGGEVSDEPLSETLLNLGGVSSRISWIVPFLLLPDWGEGRYWDLTAPVRLDDGEVNGFPCYRVQGRFPDTWRVEGGHSVIQNPLGGEIETASTPDVFWIEKQRLLLRQVADLTRFSRLRVEEVILYEPEIDVPLTEQELAPGP